MNSTTAIIHANKIPKKGLKKHAQYMEDILRKLKSFDNIDAVRIVFADSYDYVAHAFYTQLMKNLRGMGLIVEAILESEINAMTADVACLSDMMIISPEVTVNARETPIAAGWTPNRVESSMVHKMVQKTGSEGGDTLTMIYEMAPGLMVMTARAINYVEITKNMRDNVIEFGMDKAVRKKAGIVKARYTSLNTQAVAA